jgi:ferredoxin-NADP reductase
MRIRRITRETADAVTLVLEPVEHAGGAPVRFAPGQFFTLHVRIDGETHKRAYSASSSPLETDAVAVTVKRVQGGRVSTYLVERAREGDAIDVLGPSGSFTPLPSAAPRSLVLVAGGSGITPVASIVRTVLETEPGTRLALVYGNRAREDVIFADPLEALANRHGSRLEVRHVLERPPPDWTGGAGLLDAAALNRELDALRTPLDAGAEYFLCGPAPMMAAARACLEGRGVAPARIHEERFVSAHASPAAAEAGPQPVTVRLRGKTHDLIVLPGRTLLEAALDAGVDVPFSCSVGGCGTCLVHLADGQVAMDEPNCLSPRERAEGMVLACASRPTSPCVVEVP